MGTLPSRSSPSITSYMQGMKIKDKSEKGLMVRIGTLVDAVANAQRGHANAGAQLSRKSQAINAQRPPRVFAETENVFNGASVTIDPIRTAAGLSNYEIQIDADPNFGNPTTKVAFNKNIIFKGLDRGVTYNLRARGITKNGQAGPWSILDPVLTTPSDGETTADIDGYLEGEARFSKYFDFIYQSEKIFTIANFGLQRATAGVGEGEGDPDLWEGAIVLTTLTDDVISPYFSGLAFASGNLVTPFLTEDTSGVDYTFVFGESIRYWPIMMFPLFDINTFLQLADPGALNFVFPIPAPYSTSLFVGTANTPDSQEPPVVWVKFGSLT